MNPLDGGYIKNDPNYIKKPLDHRPKTPNKAKYVEKLSVMDKSKLDY